MIQNLKTVFQKLVLSLVLVMFISDGFAGPEFPDRISILQLFENRQFDKLEELIQSYQQNYEENGGDERLVVFVLETIANSNPEYEVYLDDWINSNPESYIPYLARAYYYHGVAWSWRGQRSHEKTSEARNGKMTDYLGLAAADISRVIEFKPKITAADALAIKVLMVIGSDSYMQQTLQEALEISPDSYLVRASYLLSLKPKWSGEPSDLMRFMKNIRDDAEKFPQLSSLLGYADYIFAESLAAEKRNLEASEHFDFAVERGADHIIYRERGINHYYLKQFELAKQDFDHSLKLWPQHPATLQWRARTLQRLQKDEAAMIDLDLAIRLQPMDRYILMTHARMSRRMKRYEQVLGNYEKALFYNNGDADIWFERGMHYSHELINFEAAAWNLKQATLLEKSNPAYWYEYAAVLHYNLNCEIIEPLHQYLQLCNSGNFCHPGELKWGSHAQLWLAENNRCNGENQNRP